MRPPPNRIPAHVTREDVPEGGTNSEGHIQGN